MFQMRLWALLLGVVGWLGVVSNSAAPSNRTKRQFEASHCDPTRCQIPVSTSSDIKTVKEQTFQTFRYVIGKKQKTIDSFPNLSYRRRSFLFGPGEQILDKIETICFQEEKFGNDTKTFWFRFQNYITKYLLL